MCRRLTLPACCAVSVGDKVPADIRMVNFLTATLRTDEAALTGESETVLKTTDALPSADKVQAMRNMCFSGTTVAGGKAICVVATTGMNTEHPHTSAVDTRAAPASFPAASALSSPCRPMLGVWMTVPPSLRRTPGCLPPPPPPLPVFFPGGPSCGTQRPGLR